MYIPAGKRWCEVKSPGFTRGGGWDGTVPRTGHQMVGQPWNKWLLERGVGARMALPQEWKTG